MSQPPRLQRPYFRNGPEHRGGADVSFQDIVKLFGFRAVTIGKWVETEEQQLAANLFFDALCDLSLILQVPDQVLSLNGTLSLAFGSGGQKHSSAHYDSATRTLALAKNAGGGALAHEWFHAFDHYICQKMFPNSDTAAFASAMWLEDLPLKAHPLNQKLDLWFGQLFLSDESHSPNAYLMRSVAADKALGGYYYARPQELAARAFEACIQDQALKNAFLVQGTKQSPEARLGIYPEGEFRTSLAKEILDYFRRLGEAVAFRLDASSKA